MAPAQALESRAAIRGVSLFGVFCAAKIAVCVGRDIPLSGWTLLALVWQDLLVALVFVAVFTILDAAGRRHWQSGILYALAVGYVAVNVPITRVLSSPLTWRMLEAARGELSDSIRYYLTWRQLSWAGIIVLAGLVFPYFLRRVSLPLGYASVGVAIVLIALGPLAARRVDTRGLERNPLSALAANLIPRVAPHYADDDWRASPFEEPARESLERYRAAAAGRNIVLVVLESTAAAYLHPYGAEEDPTPNLTELSRRAIMFENAYAVYPESIKGLLSMLCSQYPAFDTAPELYQALRIPSLASVLGAAGYQTALFHSGRFMYLGMETMVRNRGFDTLEDAGDIGGNHNSSFGIDEASAVRRILAWIDDVPRGRNFFVTYLPIAGHHPYATVAPGPFRENSELGRYQNALHEGDRALGELIRGLRARDLERNTLWVILGDHGEAFGQHDGNFGHTLYLYEENVRVPFFVVLPGVVKEPIRVRRAASLIDTAPTIIDLIGRNIPEEYQGHSLLDGQARMALFFTDYSLGFMGLRDGCLKYVYEIESRRSKLYNLCNDPNETIDLAHAFPERLSFYRKRLERWSGAQKDSALRIQDSGLPIRDSRF